MRRHELDIASLVMGVALLAVAVGVLAAEASGADVNLNWVLPTVLVGVGLAGLAGSLATTMRRDDTRTSDTESH